jgi:tRNA pseudouridine(38-40) synthase
VSARHTYCAVLAYDGTAFWGYSRQPGLKTVEGCLHDAIAPLLPPHQRRLNLRVGGRTDRGVSAHGQVVSFTALERIDFADLARAIDTAAPNELAALHVSEQNKSFHAQFSAVARHYTYLLPDEDTDVRKVDRLIAALIGRRDFTAFARDTPPDKSTLRTLFAATARRVRREDTEMIRFDFSGAAFLRRQVRIMVSTAIREARAGAPDDRLLEIAASLDRLASAPPCDPSGLTLVRITY